MVARLTIEGGEYAADQNLAVRLQGHGMNLGIRALACEAVIQAAVTLKPEHIIYEARRLLSVFARDQNLAIGLRNQIVKNVQVKCIRRIKRGIEAATGVEPSDAIAGMVGQAGEIIATDHQFSVGLQSHGGNG